LENETDYSRYTLDELRDARERLNRDLHPEKARKLDLEYYLRQRGETIETGVEEPPPPVRYEQQELAFLFKGTTSEYFRIWIVNLCLTLLTFGVFSAWAKVRKKRFIYSNTILDGTPFQYLARPGPILKGRIIALLGFLVYYAANHFFPTLLPWVWVAGLILAPWMISRSLAFNARYSAFRNMTFYFKGGYLGAVKVLYVWGIIPLFVIVVIFALFDLLKHMEIVLIIVLLAGILFPLWLRSLKKFIVEQTAYGGQEGILSASRWWYFKVYFKAGMIMALFSILITICLLIIDEMAGIKWIQIYGGIAGFYGAYVLAYAYTKARAGNLVWNNTRLGPLRFRSTLSALGLLGLYFTNALAVLVSLGTLIPWAIMRTHRYRADHMQVTHGGSLEEFRGSEVAAVGALGSEAIDFFDVDLSL